MFHNKIIIFLLFSTVCSLTAAQLSVTLKGVEIPSTSEAILPLGEETTTEELVRKTTATTPTTKKPITTASTPATTTTVKPTATSTTTSTPAPTKPSTTTTTAKPSTTTSGPITTTPAPKPYPDPEIGTWNSSCIMVRMAAQLNFTYLTKDNGIDHALYNIPKDAKVDDVNCELNRSESIQMNWGPVNAQHTMALQFDSVNGTFNMFIMMFTLPLLNDSFPNAKENQTIQLIHHGGEISAPMKMSYHCTRAQVFNLTETINNHEVVGTVKVHDVQVEAFRTSSSSGFSIARDCDSSETPDVVPIAVGIALVALILIVLISYLCARRRSTSRGYMSF